jgi:hypothetical protein
VKPDISRQKDVSVLVVSCDRYASLWAPFFRTFFKYWPDCPYPVYLGTGRLAAPDARVTTLATGEDIDYSTNLLAMLRRIPSEWVIFWVEDRMVSGRVDTAKVAELVAAAQQQGAAYLKLIPEHPLAYGERERDWGPVPPGTVYRISMTVCLWRKSALERILRPGDNAWQIEKLGSGRSAGLAEPFLALSLALRRRPPIPHEHVVIKGRLFRRVLGFLRREQLEELRQAWPLQSWRNAAYVMLYDLASAVLRPWQAWRLRRVPAAAPEVRA